MTRDRFVCMLRDAVMIGDGAMGTELMARGVDPAGSMELENLLHPDIVGDVHRSYVTAGSRIIETNTFAANPIYLDRVGASHRLHDILQNALARAGMTIPYNVDILPPLSSRMAAYLHNEVPGIVIPASLRALLERYGNPADQRKAGIEAAVAFVESIRDRVDRLFLIPPRNSVDAVLPVLATVHVTDLQTEDTHTKNWGTA